MISLIITTYNRPDALELVLSSILEQRLRPHEIIVADDGSTSETQELVEQYALRGEINIKHAWQEDLGFRAARVRNLALAKATGDYIIYIDGDMVLHPDFIWSHNHHKLEGYFLHGSRVILNESETAKRIDSKRLDITPFSSGIKNRLNAIQSKSLSYLCSHKSNRWDDVRSCNMSFWKKDLIAVNGFNESFIGWGREDNELVVRLMNIGLKRKNIKCCAVAYHLYHHSRQDDAGLIKNNALLNKVVQDKDVWCEVGLDQHL